MKTRVTEMLGIKYPIFMAGMNWVTNPELVAAVSNAGGLGILGAAAYTEVYKKGSEKYHRTSLKEAIRKIKELTDKPFGVNLPLAHPGVRGLGPVVIEEKVPILNFTLGKAPDLVEAVHGYGGKVISTAWQLRHALSADQRDKVDIVIVTGHEAGGHEMDTTTMVLVPEVVSRVKIPVVACGGIADGRSMAAALALGAEGVSMGTRFAVTKESLAHENYKKKVLEAGVDDTLWSDRFDGEYARVLRSPFTESLMKRRFPLTESLTNLRRMKREMGISWWSAFQAGINTSKAMEIGFSRMPILATGLYQMERGVLDGDWDTGLMTAGEVSGRINDIPTCAELIERMVREAEEVVDEVKRKISG